MPAPTVRKITRREQVERNLPDWFMEMFAEQESPLLDVWTVNAAKLAKDTSDENPA